MSFKARVDGPDVLLSWATASETINAGFEIQWRSKNAGADEQMVQEWQVAGWVDGHGTTGTASVLHLPRHRPRAGPPRLLPQTINFDDTFATAPRSRPSSRWSSVSSSSRSIDGHGLPSGLYVVRFVGETFVETQTVTLLK